MESFNYGIHEVTDIRDILNFKIVCLAESKSRLEKVGNSERKAITQQHEQLKKEIEYANTILNQ